MLPVGRACVRAIRRVRASDSATAPARAIDGYAEGSARPLGPRPGRRTAMGPRSFAAMRLSTASASDCRDCASLARVIAYCILRDGSSYRELGGNYFDQLHPERKRKRLVRRLERLGLEVVLLPRPKAATPASDETPRSAPRAWQALLVCTTPKYPVFTGTCLIEFSKDRKRSLRLRPKRPEEGECRQGTRAGRAEARARYPFQGSGSENGQRDVVRWTGANTTLMGKSHGRRMYLLLMQSLKGTYADVQPKPSYSQTQGRMVVWYGSAVYFLGNGL